MPSSLPSDEHPQKQAGKRKQSAESIERIGKSRAEQYTALLFLAHSWPTQHCNCGEASRSFLARNTESLSSLATADLRKFCEQWTKFYPDQSNKNFILTPGVAVAQDLIA